MHGIQFGTDGWRAKLDNIFSEENVVRVAEAFVKYVHRHHQQDLSVAVAFDGRTNSQTFAKIFSEVLSASKIRVFLSREIIPTPVLSFGVTHTRSCAGVMVTASHNPPAYNGIKFKAHYGGPFLASDTHEVETLLNEKIEGHRSAERIVLYDFLAPYKEYLRSLIDFAALQSYASDPHGTPSVMIDSMGGAGKTIIEEILTEAGWRAQTIFGTPDENFYDRSPEPIAQHLAPLMYNVSVTDAILGIATDGDADRCSIVYEDGRWMTAQETILALAWYTISQKKWSGDIVKSASVTDSIRILATQWQKECYDVNVGFKNITEVMLKHPIVFGAEESGGFGYGNHIPERDGILSGLLFCEMLAKTKQTLSHILRDITTAVGVIHYDRIDVHYEREDRTQILPKLQQDPPTMVGTFSIQDIVVYRESNTITGMKYIFGDSRWLLLRTSQTEPLVRIYAEGKSDGEVKEFLDAGCSLARIRV